MAVISANGARFHVQRLEPEAPAENAPLVVFVHGLVMDNLSSFYYTLAGPAVNAGARVLLYDLRGHGRSERTPRGYTTADAAADLCGVLDACGVTGPAYLAGNSYGGLVAARTALLGPGTGGRPGPDRGLLRRGAGRRVAGEHRQRDERGRAQPGVPADGGGLRRGRSAQGGPDGAAGRGAAQPDQPDRRPRRRAAA